MSIIVMMVISMMPKLMMALSIYIYYDEVSVCLSRKMITSSRVSPVIT